MSPSQLHEVFKVNELDSVPHYELVKLSHTNTALHVRKKRSIASASSFSTTSSLKLASSNSNNNLVNSNNHHVKKDLSKSAPYSEKSASNSIFANKVELQQPQSPKVVTQVNTSDNNEKSNNNNHDNNKSNNDDDEDDKERSDVIKLSEIKEHQVTFNAFGEQVNLTLRPTEGLFRNGLQSLKMWHAHPDPNATDGINYEEIKSVSLFYTFTCAQFADFV